MDKDVRDEIDRILMGNKLDIRPQNEIYDFELNKLLKDAFDKDKEEMIEDVCLMINGMIKDNKDLSKDAYYVEIPLQCINAYYNSEADSRVFMNKVKDINEIYEKIAVAPTAVSKRHGKASGFTIESSSHFPITIGENVVFDIKDIISVGKLVLEDNLDEIDIGLNEIINSEDQEETNDHLGYIIDVLERVPNK